MQIRYLSTAALLAAICLSSAAKIVEEVSRMPVQATNLYGKKIAQEIVVTVFHDDEATTPMPLLVLNHGRATDAEGRAALGRARYSENSKWFAAQGFVVAVPTRIGYGESGGEDAEDSGSCNAKRFGPAFKAGAEQTIAVIEQLRQRPDVLPARTVILGQSMGGGITVELAAMNHPGIEAAINFAGGNGGDPKSHPGSPCGQAQLKQFFKDNGARSRIPSLWIYAQNDKYWGADLPRQWADVFTAQGGVLEFTQVPPQGEDGHSFFSKGAPGWRPLVLEFLRKQGYSAPREQKSPSNP
jgi:dienelactone hydrolase